MAASEELGIIGVDAIHYFVHKPERSAGFYEQCLGFKRVAQSGADMTEETGQASIVYQGGDVRVVVSTPVRPTCRAARYLRHHPAGVGSLTFEVSDLDRAWRFLTSRDATPIHTIRETRQDGGRFRHFSITTALGDVTFRFVQKDGWHGFAPGFEAATVEPGSSPTVPSVGVARIDHVTSNAPTMAATRLWLEHVMGMEQCWQIAFHTEDVRQGGEKGTGLKSVVMWDPRSGLKFPINEPLQPFFKDGQINRFVEQNSGAGIQHIALEVGDVVAAVRTLRERQVAFLKTPSSYYAQAPERLSRKQVNVDHLRHKLSVLEPLGILIDGSPVDNYLIQIFLEDASTLYAEPEAGPFFYELIERCGDNGFGEGNFRALFEAIEREQVP